MLKTSFFKFKPKSFPCVFILATFSVLSSSNNSRFEVVVGKFVVSIEFVVVMVGDGVDVGSFVVVVNSAGFVVDKTAEVVILLSILSSSFTIFLLFNTI